MKIEAAFWGLCSAIRREAKGPLEIYLPLEVPADAAGHGSGHGNAHGEDMRHVATLSIPVEQIDIHSGTWAPSGAIQVGRTQFAYWVIPAADTLTFGPRGSAPTWSNPDDSIQFREVHKTHPALEMYELQKMGYPVVLLSGGTLQGTTVEKRRVRKPGKEPEDLGMARRLRWKHRAQDFRITNAAGRFIELRKDAEITLTNVALRPSDGSAHFDMYYSLLKDSKNIPSADRIHYNPPGESLRIMMPDVFDCVPPTGGS
jgi:hypothetical protein